MLQINLLPVREARRKADIRQIFMQLVWNPRLERGSYLENLPAEWILRERMRPLSAPLQLAALKRFRFS